jgi:hypothetical protein
MTTSKGSNLFGRLLGRREPGSEGEATRVSQAAAADAPRPVINDATGYGVQIQPPKVDPETWYWQAVRVHHMTPQENGGNHHIYMDVYDGATVRGCTSRGTAESKPLRWTNPRTSRAQTFRCGSGKFARPSAWGCPARSSRPTG